MEKFLNPYNFISFPPKKASAYKYDGSKCMTGVIRYKVTTRSPLFLPNSSTDEAFAVSQKFKDHKSYDFFSYRQLSPYSKTQRNPEPPCPVIPGSEIRGVIRSVYETLTDSCMGVLNSETMPVKRSPERFSTGLLKKTADGYKLLEAESYRIGKAAEKDRHPIGFEDNINGTKIFFKDPGISEDDRKVWKNCITIYRIAQGSEQSPKNMKETGYLMKWGMGGKKKRYHVFVPGKEIGNGLSREDIETRLLGVIESYLDQPMMKKDSQKDNKRAYEEYKNNLVCFLRSPYDSESYFPVTYSILNNGKIDIKPAIKDEEESEKNAEKEIKWYLAPAIYTKEISNNTVGKLAGEFDPCHGDQECPACDLFGHVDKSGTGSRGSRLRFSDLQVEEMKSPKAYYHPITTLPALGGPKLGNVDFYLKKPENATFWTYDYYYKYKDNGRDIVLIEEPGELRGRKYYWHHPEYCLKNSKNLPTDKPGTLNKTVRPLESGVSFIGELYFEDITEKQLKQLVWILNSEKEKIGYKLGAAKPFGFGSIVCQVLEVTERKITVENGQIHYREDHSLAEKYSDISYEDADFSSHCKDQFHRIAGLDSVKEEMKITYPKTWKQACSGDNREGFRWFSENHTNIYGNGMPNNRKQRKICVALPDLTETDVGLPYNVSGVESNRGEKRKDTYDTKKKKGYARRRV